jgi:hypothetical protein
VELQKSREEGERLGAELQKSREEGERLGAELQKSREEGERLGVELQKSREESELFKIGYNRYVKLSSILPKKTRNYILKVLRKLR